MPPRTFSTSSTPYRAVSPNAATHNAKAQRADPNSLFHHYRQLVQLRRSEPALLKGSYEQVQVQGPVLSFVRKAEGQTLRVWLNYSAEAQSIEASGRLVWAAPQSASSTRLPAWGVRVERL